MPWPGWEDYVPPSKRTEQIAGDTLRRLTPQKRTSKYGAEPTVVDGIRFDSKKEAARYAELKLLEKAGEIFGLRLQPEFPLHAHAPGAARRIGVYVADFEYVTEHETGGPAGTETRLVVEDVKGFKTPLYRWKKKHVEAQYGIEIREV